MAKTFFSRYPQDDSRDRQLVAQAVQGSQAGLEELVRRHQSGIYNLAVRMVGNTLDAEDVTQEVLIKAISKLSTFRAESSFRTWLYRITANHVLNMRTRPREQARLSFDQYGQLIENIPDGTPPSGHTSPVEADLLVEETKIACMMGMTLCLDRPQRLAFILGAIFKADSAAGGEITGVSAANFRQTLSRARAQLGNFMNEKCGLMNKANPCRCAKKTRAAIEAGFVDSQRLQFDKGLLQDIHSIFSHKTYKVDDVLALRAELLFRKQPLFEPPDYVRFLKSLLQRSEIRPLIDFSPSALRGFDSNITH